GRGISPNFLPFVFDRFRQADSSSTRTHGGLGIGLTIVRHIIELHGGTVHAESPGEGQGATFIVTLPLASRPAVAMEREVAQRIRSDEPRAAASDDNRQERQERMSSAAPPANGSGGASGGSTSGSSGGSSSGSFGGPPKSVDLSGLRVVVVD